MGCIAMAAMRAVSFPFTTSIPVLMGVGSEQVLSHFPFKPSPDLYLDRASSASQHEVGASSEQPTHGHSASVHSPFVLSAIPHQRGQLVASVASWREPNECVAHNFSDMMLATSSSAYKLSFQLLLTIIPVAVVEVAAHDLLLRE